jgi:Cu+-exporting ATPase
MFRGGQVYFDTAAMIITLVLLGRYLESLAKHRASQAVHRLLALQPREARVVRGQARAIVETSSVGRGELIEVRPGEKIPLDGIVKSGATEVDESLVTGESRPVERSAGGSVIGGSLNGMGTIVIEVTHTGRETVLAQIAELVERAQTVAVPVQRFADRISAYFIPFVLVIAVATFWYWNRFFYPTHSMLIAVSVLVISCPCALGLATPVAVLAGMGAAARRGILFKGGDILERMHKVDTVVLDKTGTITAGKMRVSDVQGPESDETILRFAASAEQGSEHLLGQAIVAGARERDIALHSAEEFTAIPGQGASALVNGQRTLVGKRTLLEQRGITVSSAVMIAAERLEMDGRTVVYVSRSSEVLGVIGLMDAPKPDAAAAVLRLKRAGVSVVMITGDNQETARIIGERTGIELVRSGVLPEGKAEEVLKLRRSGRVVVMAGDGINDAPALSAADVGIAMASGTDIAMESADVVIMRSDLTGVADALDLSRRTFRVISQNLFWAFFYNLAALPLAMAGFLNPIIAAAAMAVSSITVVLNSLRLR